MIEIYVPENSTLSHSMSTDEEDQQKVPAQKVAKRKTGQVIEVAKPPIPFSLAQLDHVSNEVCRAIYLLVCSKSY